MSLRTAAPRRREETGPGLGICCSLPILPIADWYTTWRTRIVGRRSRIQQINCGDLKARKTSKVHREGHGGLEQATELARDCRARLDLEAKLAAKCAWQRVPDRVSLLCSHPGFSPLAHTHTPLALCSWGVETGEYLFSKNVEEKERIQSNFGGSSPHYCSSIRPLTELRWVFFPLLSSFSPPRPLVFAAQKANQPCCRCTSMFPRRRCVTRKPSLCFSPRARVPWSQHPALVALTSSLAVRLCFLEDFENFWLPEVARRQGGRFFFSLSLVLFWQRGLLERRGLLRAASRHFSLSPPSPSTSLFPHFFSPSFKFASDFGLFRQLLMLAPEQRCWWEDAPRLTTRKYTLLINALLWHVQTGWGTVWVEEPEERRGSREAGGGGGFRNWVAITLTCMGCQITAAALFLLLLHHHLLLCAHFDSPEEDYQSSHLHPQIFAWTRITVALCCASLQQKLSLDAERIVDLKRRACLWSCICSLTRLASVFSGPYGGWLNGVHI